MANEKKVIKSINPATLEVNAEIPTTSASDVQSIVDGARKAQKAWAALGINGRQKYFVNMISYISKNRDDIAKIITLDNGKTLVESVNAEIMPVMDMLHFCLKEAPKALKNESLSSSISKVARVKSVNIFEPLGVVAVIAPWNFPFCIPVTQSLMALVTGNTVVLKPAALTAYVGQMIEKLFRESEFPERVFNVIQGSGSILGDAIMSSGVNRVAFTGSVPIGKHLMQKAGETLTPITLELGGKDPFIVLEDADLERASSGAVWGAFVNAGQVCASVERVYVHEKVANTFIELVEQKTKRIRVGNGLDFDTDMGPMIDDGQLCIVEEHIADAVAKGAKVIAGGKRIKSLPGNFFEPTVLVDVDHSMECMNEETFGPTLPIMVFSSDDEAVALANDSKFALTASVWSKNIPKAKRICREIVSGTTTINDCEFTYGFAQCPWGGPKESGIGRTHSVHGLLEFTNMKNLCVTTPMFRDNIWWYPYSQKKYNGMKTAMITYYNNRLFQKC